MKKVILAVIAMFIMLLTSCGKSATGDEKKAEDYVKAKGYRITSRDGQVRKYTLEKSRLYKGTKNISYQQIWGVQKVEPDKYFGKEIIVYGFIVKNHPLEKIPKQSRDTRLYIMLSESEVIGGYSYPNADVSGAFYSVDGKTLEEVTGLSFKEWQESWKKKYGN